MRTYHIPVFVPHKGCPNDCVFCNQRQITGQIADVTKEDVVSIIEENLDTISADSYVEVAFFGGSFTGIDIDKQRELLSAVEPYVKSGRVNGIRCSTRADYITIEILTMLKEYGMTAIELGVQSTDDYVLSCSRRGHSFSDVVKASELIKSFDIELGLQMMLGLPGDTKEKMLKTCEDLISLEPKCVRIYPTLVVPDTALWQMYDKGEYAPLSLEETVDILSVIMPKFKNAGINIIRVGLQTTDNINENTVSGPYHPAVRELAEGRIVRNVMEKYITGDALNVCVNPSRVSVTVGHKRCNSLYFKEKYSCRLSVTEDATLNVDEMKINGKRVNI